MSYYTFIACSRKLQCGEYRTPPDSWLIEYIPPRTPLPNPDFAYYDPNERICIIHGSMRGEDWDTKKLRQQKLPLRQHDFFMRSALERRAKLQLPALSETLPDNTY